MKISSFASRSARSSRPLAWKFALTALTILAAGGVSAAATNVFTATATVQNSFTISQTSPLTFGTVFATVTGLTTGAQAITAGDSAYLALSPTGSVTPTSATSATTKAPKILGLGGATAGAYSVSGLPANGNIGITFLDSNNVSLIGLTPPALNTCGYDTSTAAITANRIVLTNGADPSAAFFCVDTFTTDTVNAGLLGASNSVAGTGHLLGFTVTTLNFNLGATLIGSNPVSTGVAAKQFQSGTYTGTFGMQVAFP